MNRVTLVEVAILAVLLACLSSVWQANAEEHRWALGADALATVTVLPEPTTEVQAAHTEGVPDLAPVEFTLTQHRPVRVARIGADGPPPWACPPEYGDGVEAAEAPVPTKLPVWKPTVQFSTELTWIAFGDERLRGQLFLTPSAEWYFRGFRLGFSGLVSDQSQDLAVSLRTDLAAIADNVSSIFSGHPWTPPTEVRWLLAHTTLSGLFTVVEPGWAAGAGISFVDAKF